MGMGLGTGYYLAAGCASILIVFILAVLPYVQYRIDKINQIKIIRVKALADSDAKFRIEEALKEFKLHFRTDFRINFQLTVWGFAKWRKIEAESFYLDGT